MVQTQGNPLRSCDLCPLFNLFLQTMLIVGISVYVCVPVEAEMKRELCEDEVFSQQAVGLGRLHSLLRGHRDQTGFLVETL